MKKILILQNTLLHYRKSLYNELAKYYDITILHSGKKTVIEHDKYKEILKKKSKIGPFIFQSGVLSEVQKDSYDVIIAMLDLHWITNIFSMYFHNKKSKFIWWGSWLTNNYFADKIKIFLTNQKYPSIFYSQDAKNSFVGAGVDEKKLFVANNTYDVGERIRCYENKTKNSILFVGSLDKRKQLDVLIRAYFNIKGKIPSTITLVIVGAGEEIDNLKILVKKLNLSNFVKFKGKVNNRTKLLNFYKQAIVSVSFGQAGLSVLQSLGFGVPFITKLNAISGGEKTNIQQGENGFLIKDNIHSLESILLKLCLDIDYSRRLGENAYNYYSENCTIKKMAQSFTIAIERNKSNKG